jgi:hypothetical protein
MLGCNVDQPLVVLVVAYVVEEVKVFRRSASVASIYGK